MKFFRLAVSLPIYGAGFPLVGGFSTIDSGLPLWRSMPVGGLFSCLIGYGLGGALARWLDAIVGPEDAEGHDSLNRDGRPDARAANAGPTGGHEPTPLGGSGPHSILAVSLGVGVEPVRTFSARHAIPDACSSAPNLGGSPLVEWASGPLYRPLHLGTSGGGSVPPSFLCGESRRP
jgi:hypothetical protein